MSRVLLLGYFGAGNFGDDALLADWLLRRRNWLASRGIAVDVVTSGQDALGRFVEGTELAGLVANWIPKYDAPGLEPREYTALIAPGGSLLQDVTSVKSLMYYLWMIRRFAAGGSRVFMLNQGIGPLNSWLASVLTPRALGRTALLSLRDHQSHNWAQARPQLRRHPALMLSADPVLSSGFAPVDFRQELGLPAEYAVVIAKPTKDLPTPRDPTPEPQALAELIGHSVRTTALEHFLVALQSGADLEFCEEVAEATGPAARVLALDARPYSASLCHSILHEASVVISYRLHGLVAAAAGSALAFGVAYDPKITALCEELALPFCFPATVHEEQTLIDFARYWRERAEAASLTRERVAQCIDRHRAAEEAFDDVWG